MNAGDLIPLAIEKPAAGGRMIARPGGRVVLVSGAIPGERVQARVERIGKGVVYAETVRVDAASPDRREPSADPLCGGMLYGHIAYPRQLAIKREIVLDAFARIGKLELAADLPVAGSPEEGYRMRARLHVRGGRVGFFREATHDLCDARGTRQLLPATCDALDRIAAAIRSLGLSDVTEIELSENVSATERVAYVDAPSPLDPRMLQTLTTVEGFTPGPYVTDTLRIEGVSIALRRHVLAFFQGNRYLLADLVTHVMARIAAGRSLVDLYAGAGLFAVAAAATRGAVVTAVEGDPFAADDLAANARASRGQLTTLRMPVEGMADHARTGRAASQVADGSAFADTAVVDPPRTGMSAEALSAVLDLSARRIIYVSCDVATLARDARRLVAGGYTVADAAAFDLFPNTPHVESVVVFDRR